ncbi:serine protease, partial [Cystoisospora suis]
MVRSRSLGTSSFTAPGSKRMKLFVSRRFLFLCSFVAAPWVLRTAEAAGPGAGDLPDLPIATVSSALHQAVALSYIDAKNANMLVSPLSVWRSLRLLEDGASGSTLTEMVSLLDLSSADLDVDDVSSSPYVEDTGITVDAAERVYKSPVQDPTLEQYCLAEEAKFHTEHETVDFGGPGVAEHMNSFVRSLTKNTLKYAVSPSSFYPDTRLTVINGLFFDAPWGLPFRLSDSSEIGSDFGGGLPDENCQYMERAISRFETEFILEGPVLAMRLPFSHRDLAMYIFMPENLQAFEADPSFPQMIDDLVEQMHQGIYERWQNPDQNKGSVRLVLPRFVIRPHVNSYDLSVALKAMGVNELFDEADLSQMTDAAGIRVDSFPHSPG